MGMIETQFMKALLRSVPDLKTTKLSPNRHQQFTKVYSHYNVSWIRLQYMYVYFHKSMHPSKIDTLK